MHAQEEVPRPPQEEEFMLAQVNQMRRQIQAQQQAAAQKKARIWPCSFVLPLASLSHNAQSIHVHASRLGKWRPGGRS